MLAELIRIKEIHQAHAARKFASPDETITLEIPPIEDIEPNNNENREVKIARDVVSSFGLVDREGALQLEKQPKKVYARDLGLYDLNAGFENSILVCREPDGTPIPDYWNKLHVGDDLMYEMRGFYRWIVESQYFSRHSRPQVVAYTRDLAKILCTPYTAGSDSVYASKGWRLLITRIDNVIFICDGGAACPEERDSSPFHREKALRGGYHGLKLRSLLTTPPAEWHPPTKRSKDDAVLSLSPEDDVVINEFDKLYQIFKMRISCLALSNSVDGLDPNGNKVDISVSSSMSGSWFYAGKLLNRWSHCILDGVPTIVIGSRRVADGTLRAIRSFPVDTTPSMVAAEAKKGGFQAWNTKICYNFLEKFLEFIKKRIPPAKQSANEVWIATCAPSVQPVGPEGEPMTDGKEDANPSVEFKFDSTGAYRFLPKDVVASLSSRIDSSP